TNITDSDRNNLSNLTNKFLSFSEKEKKITFADSLAKYYRKLHSYDSSAKYFEEAANLSPTEDRLIKAGDAYYDAYSISPDESKAGYTEKARGFYNKVLAKSPKNLDVKTKVALTYIGSESTMEGVTLLREVIKEDPKNESAIYNLGVLSIQSGQYSKAIDRFKELITLNPGNPNAHFYLGLSYLSSGNKNKARKSFEVAKTLNSDPAFQSTIDTYLKEAN
ncbi:MAG TPA: tetratricopeptide repeat protein, partial [Cytophagaceae bacterium]